MCDVEHPDTSVYELSYLVERSVDLLRSSENPMQRAVQAAGNITQSQIPGSTPTALVYSKLFT